MAAAAAHALEQHEEEGIAVDLLSPEEAKTLCCVHGDGCRGAKNAVLAHGAVRYVCLECGPERVFECEACHPRHGHMMGRDTEHYIHKRNAVAGPTVAVTVSNALRAYADRPFLRGRAGWLTYGDVARRACSFALRLARRVPRGARVGICGPNAPEWVVCDLACALAGAVSVGLHAAFDAAALADVVRRLDVAFAVATAPEEAQKLASIDGLALVAFDDAVLDDWEDALLSFTPPAEPEPEPEQQQQQNEKRRCTACGESFASRAPQLCNACFFSPANAESAARRAHDEAEARRLAAVRAALRAQVPRMPDDTFTIILTSGTTGAPKGVEEPDAKWNSDVCASTMTLWPLVTPSYIPLSHSSDRLRVYETMVGGGRVGFCRYASGGSRVDDLFEDLRALRPTALLAPPRIWNHMFRAYDGDAARARADFDSLQAVNTGAAPLSAPVRAFLGALAALGVHVSEGYGTSEAGGIAYAVARRDGSWTGLRPMRVTRFALHGDGKLHRHTAQPELKLDPHTGELFVRSEWGVSPRYVGVGDDVPPLRDADGWHATGDVCRLLESGEIELLARIVETFKVSSGEKFVPGALEALYATSDLVQDVVVVGDAAEDAVIALVVARSDSDGDSDSADAVLADLQRIGAAHGRQPFEIPASVVVLDGGPGLRNAMGKVERRALRERFRAQIDAAFAAGRRRS